MSRQERAWRTALLAALLLSSGTACTRYGDQTSVVELPSRDTFSPVSGVLETRCGSLDCHGAPARNLRVYGVHGLRGDGSSVTGSPDTTDEEIDATYESVTGIDPEVLSRVLSGDEEDPSRWIVLSKGTEREAHVGGARLPPGSAGHRCIVSWATGGEDLSSCTEDVFGPEPRDGEAW
jgi:hypothetical protein